MRELEQEADDAEPRQPRIARQKLHCAERIGSAQAKRRAPLGRQRFRQDEVAIAEIGKAHDRRREEGQPEIVVAEQTAERRAHHEAEAEGSPQHAEGLRPLFRRGNVGNIGLRRRHGRRKHPGKNPPDKQHPERRRHRHDQVVDAEPEIGHQDHRPPAVTIRQRAEHRRGKELHHRPDRHEHPEHERCLLVGPAEKGQHQLRQHRNDDPDRQHVQHDRDEDEDKGRRPRPSHERTFPKACSMPEPADRGKGSRHRASPAAPPPLSAALTGAPIARHRLANLPP